MCLMRRQKQVFHLFWKEKRFFEYRQLEGNTLITDSRNVYIMREVKGREDYTLQLSRSFTELSVVLYLFML